MKIILKPMLAMGVIVMSLLITAVSCDKEPVAGNNSGNNPNDNSSNSNSGNNFSGRTGDLRLVVGSDATDFVKIKDNTVYISATGLANKLTPLSKTDDVDRSFGDLIDANTAASNLRDVSYIERPFYVSYPGAPAAMFFVNRTHVTKDTIALRALRAHDTCAGDGERNENTQAEAVGGGVCRRYIETNNVPIAMLLYNELGTIFDNAKTTSHARGKMACSSSFGKWDRADKKYLPITETLEFNFPNEASCYIGVVNNGLGTGVEIDDAWVSDSGSTTEVELYTLAIDITGKTIPEFSSAAGFNRSQFTKALDNAAFKKILEKNYWADLRFKVKIVTAANF